ALMLTLNIFFFFTDTATTELYTLSLHDALPISTPLWAWAIRTCSWLNCHRLWNQVWWRSLQTQVRAPFPAKGANPTFLQLPGRATVLPCPWGSTPRTRVMAKCS